jgi:hypothetical protein
MKGQCQERGRSRHLNEPTLKLQPPQTATQVSKLALTRRPSPRCSRAVQLSPRNSGPPESKVLSTVFSVVFTNTFLLKVRVSHFVTVLL